MDIYNQVSASTQEVLKRLGNQSRQGGPLNLGAVLWLHGHERNPSRHTERFSDLGGDTGNRTPDLPLAIQDGSWVRVHHARLDTLGELGRRNA